MKKIIGALVVAAIAGLGVIAYAAENEAKAKTTTEETPDDNEIIEEPDHDEDETGFDVVDEPDHDSEECGADDTDAINTDIEFMNETEVANNITKLRNVISENYYNLSADNRETYESYKSILETFILKAYNKFGVRPNWIMCESAHSNYGITTTVNTFTGDIATTDLICFGVRLRLIQEVPDITDKVIGIFKMQTHDEDDDE